MPDKKSCECSAAPKLIKFEHLLVTDLGFSKGEAEVSTESVGKIAAEGVKLLTKGAFL